MSDAYEIGITLALENGVSDGIAAIRRDLSALDQAIAQSTAGLAQLRAVASGVLATAGTEVRRTAGLGSVVPPVRLQAAPGPAVALAAETVQTPAARLSPAVQAPATAAGEVRREAGDAVRPAGAAPASTPASAPASAPTAAAVSAAPVIEMRVDAASPQAAPEAARAPVAAAAPAMPAASSAGPDSGRDTAIVAAAPVVQPGAPLAPRNEAAPVAAPAAVTVAAPVSQAPAASQARAAPQAPATSQAVPQAPDFAAFGRSLLPPGLRATAPEPRAELAVAERPGQGRETMQAPAGRAAYEAPDGGDRAASMPAAGAAREARPRSAEAGPATATQGVPYASAAPAASGGGQMQISGDVTLDGQKVGRWMSDRMARDAGRPPSGPTGFDASRSPAWPGAAVS